MPNPELNFLLLVLEVSSNATPGGIYESPGASETLLKESFELDPRQKSHCLASTFILMPTKADPTTKEQSGKRCAIEAGSAGGIEVIFTLLAEVLTFHIELLILEIGEPSLQLTFSVAYRFRTTALTLEERIHAELHDLLQIFFNVLCRSGGRNWCIWRTRIAWCC